MGGIPPLIVDEPALAAADRSCKIGGVPSTVHLICTNRTTHSEGSTIGVDSRKRRRLDGRSSESPPRDCCEAKRAGTVICAELARRSGTRTRRPNSYKQTHVGETVHGFHFVCPTEKGITRNSDGTVWTGTWVVDKDHAERATKIGGYVALHAGKSKPAGRRLW